MTAATHIETTFREADGRILAALISQFGDFTLAEDGLQDALVNALERWENDQDRFHIGLYTFAQYSPASFSIADRRV